MGNKRFNKQVPGFGYVAGQPGKGTEAAVGQTSPAFKKALAAQNKKVKGATSK